MILFINLSKKCSYLFWFNLVFVELKDGKIDL